MPHGVLQVTFARSCARVLDQPLTERVDLEKVGAHPFEHDLAGDIHHVAVAHPVLVHYRGHLNARAELAALGLRAEDTHLRRGEIVEDRSCGIPVSGRGA